MPDLNLSTTSSFSCAICEDKFDGYLLYNDTGGNRWAKKCECYDRRQELKKLRSSGMEDTASIYRFDNYIVSRPWQGAIKAKAIDFLNDNYGKWFFIGGQVGSGKSHLCTAIASTFSKRGYNTYYMMWRDEIERLRAVRFDDYKFQNRLNKLKNVKVLYIDDLYKTDNPDTFEKNMTYEIINARYMHQSDITIISTQLTIQELTALDEAVGSRIYERTKDYRCSIPHDTQLNYRMKIDKGDE